MQPASPFNVDAGASQDVTISLPMNTILGNFNLQVGGSSGVGTHAAGVTLTILPVIKTYDTGNTLYLETDTPTETRR